MFQYFLDDVFAGLVTERLYEIGFGCNLAFADVEEDVWDLENIVLVGFDFVSPFEDFVLVAGDFKALLA